MNPASASSVIGRARDERIRTHRDIELFLGRRPPRSLDADVASPVPSGPVNGVSGLPYARCHELDPLRWLELTLSSGVVRYQLVGPVQAADI